MRTPMITMMTDRQPTDGQTDTDRQHTYRYTDRQHTYRYTDRQIDRQTHLFEDGGLRLGVHDEFDVAFDGSDGMLQLLRHGPIRVRQSAHRRLKLKHRKITHSILLQTRTETQEKHTFNPPTGDSN